MAVLHYLLMTEGMSCMRMKLFSRQVRKQSLSNFI